MPKSSFICKKSGPAPILSPDPLLFLVYQIAQPYKKTQAVSRLTKSHSKSSVSATLSLHPSLGGRPWLGECFLWFVSFAPKEMNESFCFFSKRRLLILIHTSILFNERQKPFEHLYSLRLHLISIKSLSIGLAPVEHIMLLNPMARRIPMVPFQELNHLIKSHYPSFVLCHIFTSILNSVFCQSSSTIHISPNQTTKCSKSDYTSLDRYNTH